MVYIWSKYTVHHLHHTVTSNVCTHQLNKYIVLWTSQCPNNTYTYFSAYWVENKNNKKIYIWKIWHEYLTNLTWILGQLNMNTLLTCHEYFARLDMNIWQDLIWISSTPDMNTLLTLQEYLTGLKWILNWLDMKIWPTWHQYLIGLTWILERLDMNTWHKYLARLDMNTLQAWHEYIWHEYLT